ncbi:MAG TPA: hypothetical protein VMF07_16810 [Solirubrobacteraceae bacterium]|nr:hypothetical protein [Solirubrobacteraceae bacterium]
MHTHPSWKSFGRIAGWLSLVACTGGLLSFVPALVSARRSGSLRWQRLAAGDAVLAAATVAMLSLSNALAGLMFVALLGIGCAEVICSRSLRKGPAEVPPELLRAEARARKLEMARRIAERDPQRARTLGIGRPDLDWAFDGGLLDVNHAPARVLVEFGGLDLQTTELLVALRERHGSFSSMADLDLHVDLPPRQLDQLSEVAVFLPDR